MAGELEQFVSSYQPGNKVTRRERDVKWVFGGPSCLKGSPRQLSRPPLIYGLQALQKHYCFFRYSVFFLLFFSARLLVFETLGTR